MLSVTDMWERDFLFAEDSQLPEASIKFAEAATWAHTEIIRARNLYYREKQITASPS